MNLENAEKQYLSLGAPVMLFNNELELISCNEAAKNASGALRELITDDIKKSIAEKLARFSTARLLLSHFPGIGDDAVFIKTDFGSVAVIDRSSREPVASLPYAINGADRLGEQVRGELEGVLLGSAALERHFDSDDPEVEEIFENVRRSAYHVLRTVTNATLVSSLLSGENVSRPRLVDISERVKALCEAAQAVSSSRLSIEVTPAAKGITAFIDDKMFDRAFLNLILNAVQYGADTPVRVSVRATDDRAAVSVSDTGFGMTSENLARAKDPYFSREPSGDEGDRHGLGLGLTIASAFCRIHGGSLMITSSDGEGTTATLTFARSQGDDGSAVLRESSTGYITDLRSRVYIELCDISSMPV